MQIKKRYIKEEIKRIEKINYVLAMYKDKTGHYDYELAMRENDGTINALEWVLGFADD
jgi:hypothetical protein